MKILMINDYGYQVGGVETYISAISKELSKHHDVKIFSTNINIDKTTFNGYTYSGLNRFPQFITNMSRAFNPISFVVLNRTLKNYEPDLVHIHHIFNHTSPSVLALLSKYPTIMTMHTQTLLCPMNKYDKNFGILNYSKFDASTIKIIGHFKYIFNKVKYYFYEKYLTNVDLFLAVSDFIKTEANNGSISPVKTLYLGLDLPKYSAIKQGYNILFIGRLTHNKGVEILIKAFKDVISYIPSAHLTIIGEGEELNSLINLSQELNLEDKITFAGKKPRSEIYSYIKNTQVVVVPSLWQEPFGLVGVEALSVGRPVIASTVGGIPEWLDDKTTGFLVPPGDPIAISRKIVHLLSDRKLLSKMSIKAAAATNKYSIRTHVNKLNIIYTNLINHYSRKI